MIYTFEAPRLLSINFYYHWVIILNLLIGTKVETLTVQLILISFFSVFIKSLTLILSNSRGSEQKPGREHRHSRLTGLGLNQIIIQFNQLFE